MIYVIGDIHGEIKKLTRLISFIEEQDDDPAYVFIGDYLDKGENSSETLVFLCDLRTKRECIFLMGNHEYLWLNLEKNQSFTENYLMRYGAKATMKSFNVDSLESAKKKMMKNFSSFFESLKPYWIYGDYVAVHSGIPPEYYQTPIEKIPIEQLLFNRYDFIKERNMYLNRYKIIFGHTGFYYPYIDHVKTGIDTAACYIENQPLTAFCPEKNFFIDSNSNSYTIDNLNFSICPNIVRLKSRR